MAEHRSDRDPALDGLRTFACGAVIAFHLLLPFSAGGWLGVDVFFVLSGYLITGVLLREYRAHGRIRLLAFWGRRALRLYPALVVTVLAVSLLSAVGALEGDKGSGVGIALALTYTTNLAMALGHESGSLSHTWSLAIEEQFYLLWPLCLMLAGVRRRVTYAAVAGAAGSLGVMMVLAPSRLDPGAFYWPHTRMWELLAGCVLAVALHDRPDRVALLPGRWLAAVSVPALAGGLVVGAMPISSPLGHPSAALLLVVAGTLALLAAIRAGAWPAKALAVRPLPWIGQRTYGAYLLHVPIASLAWRSELPASVRTAFVVLATLALADASFRWVEAPVRAVLTPRRANSDVVKVPMHSRAACQWQGCTDHPVPIELRELHVGPDAGEIDRRSSGASPA